MKYFIIALATAFFSVSAYAADAAPETKKVCVKNKDAKTGKEVEKCRDVKIHKKLEGTEIPPKK
jgi:hypothetical protein